MSWVYVLKCASGRYYIGSTDNLERHLDEHRAGGTRSTRRLGELQLVITKELSTISAARALERERKDKKNPRIAIHLLNML